MGGSAQRDLGTSNRRVGCYLPVLTRCPKLEYESAEAPITMALIITVFAPPRKPNPRATIPNVTKAEFIG